MEDETLAGAGALIDHPDEAPDELSRITVDTYVGMAFSNLIAFFIILTTAVTLNKVTLNKAGITTITTSAQAVEALRPSAGEFAFLLFSLGIVGTGLLALPVLAGSAAYAIGELRGWRLGLELRPEKARSFYGVIALAYCLGLAMLVLPIDPIKAMFWSAVLNGIIAVPLMIGTMIVVSNRKHLGRFVSPTGLKIMGWLATAALQLSTVARLAKPGSMAARLYDPCA